jgi:hypothetical protein
MDRRRTTAGDLATAETCAVVRSVVSYPPTVAGLHANFKPEEQPQKINTDEHRSGKKQNSVELNLFLP